jgi:hypothetical protein
MTALILFWSTTYSYGTSCQICSDSPLPNWGWCDQFSICDQRCNPSDYQRTCDGTTDFGMLCPPC